MAEKSKRKVSGRNINRAKQALDVVGGMDRGWREVFLLADLMEALDPLSRKIAKGERSIRAGYTDQDENGEDRIKRMLEFNDELGEMMDKPHEVTFHPLTMLCMETPAKTDDRDRKIGDPKAVAIFVQALRPFIDPAEFKKLEEDNA